MTSRGVPGVILGEIPEETSKEIIGGITFRNFLDELPGVIPKKINGGISKRISEKFLNESEKPWNYFCYVFF